MCRTQSKEYFSNFTDIFSQTKLTTVFWNWRYRYYIRITVYQKKKNNNKKNRKKNSDLHFSVATVGTAYRKNCRVDHGYGVQIITREMIIIYREY